MVKMPGLGVILPVCKSCKEALYLAKEALYLAKEA